MNGMMRRLVLAVAMMAVLGLGATPGRAALLSDLIQTGGSIVQGNLLFSDFDFVNIDTPPIGGPLSPSGINVEGFTDVLGNAGLRLTAPFFIQGSGQPSIELYTVLVFYTASILDPAFLISDIHLSFLGDIDDDVGFFLSLDAIDTASLGRARVSGQGSIGARDASAKLSRSVPMVRMQSDLSLIVNGGSGASGGISGIFNSYSLAPVPEPGTLLLIGCGLVGLGAGVWRRSHRK